MNKNLKVKSSWKIFWIFFICFVLMILSFIPLYFLTCFLVCFVFNFLCHHALKTFEVNSDGSPPCVDEQHSLQSVFALMMDTVWMVTMWLELLVSVFKPWLTKISNFRLIINQERSCGFCCGGGGLFQPVEGWFLFLLETAGLLLVSCLISSFGALLLSVFSFFQHAKLYWTRSQTAWR